MNRKHSICCLLAALFICGTLGCYIFYYQLPAVRFAHRIIPLISRTETVSTYQKDTYGIRVTQRDENTEICFFSEDGLNQIFYVEQEGYTISAFDAHHKKIISGRWMGRLLRGDDGQAIPEYIKMKTRLKQDSFSPEASAAIYIYKTFSTATRGGKRAPKLIFIAVIVWLTFLMKLDAGSIGERNLKYTLPMLNDYGKKEKSVQTTKGEQIVSVSAGVFGAVCIGILLYDILCF